jgi:hypothetical protein
MDDPLPGMVRICVVYSTIKSWLRSTVTVKMNNFLSGVTAPRITLLHVYNIEHSDSFLYRNIYGIC